MMSMEEIYCFQKAHLMQWMLVKISEIEVNHRQEKENEELNYSLMENPLPSHGSCPLAGFGIFQPVNRRRR
jgi:nucleoid DNA-binding protein